MLTYIFTFVLGCVFYKWLPDIKQRIFAVVNAYIQTIKNEDCEAFKNEIFKSIGDIKSHIPELRINNAIKILEIGAGTGTNLRSFPDGCHLVIVDPNPHFRKYYDENKAKNPNIKSEEIIVAKGEQMDMVADCSVDAVVVTYVMCSAEDVQAILRQILRVLVPGGKFYFVEHVREWDSERHGTRQFLQDWLTKLAIWPNLFDGCHLNRETLKDIRAAGFSKLQLLDGYIPMDHPILRLANSQIRGIATK